MPWFTLVSIAAAVLLIAAGMIAWRVRSALAASGKRFTNGLGRHGLGSFNETLRADVAAGKRPAEALALTRMMVDILDEVGRTIPERDQAAIVEPPDSGYRLACEELVKLGRLRKVPSGAYTPALGEGGS